MTNRATDEEIARLREAIQDQRPQVRQFLARKLGGNPDDYHAGKYLAEDSNA